MRRGHGGCCQHRRGESEVTAARGRWALRGGQAVQPRAVSPPGSSQVENIQPFSAKDLSIRSLGDRIRDLGQLRNLYPNTPKDQAFGSHYNSEWGEQGGLRGEQRDLGPGSCCQGWRCIVPRGAVAHGCFSSPRRRADGQGRPRLRLHRHQDDSGKREVGGGRRLSASPHGGVCTGR